jgi:hypothetical protein
VIATATCGISLASDPKIARTWGLQLLANWAAHGLPAYDGCRRIRWPANSIRTARQTVADFNTVADNTSAGDNQASRCLLLVRGVGDSSGYLVEGIAGLHDWQTIPD